MTTDILATALALNAAGISVVPVRADGTKAPATAWKTYTSQRATEQQLHDWFPDNTPLGVGAITGQISGRLELLEIEGRAMADMPALLELLDGAELTGLYQQILQGWSEQSPSGGLHLFYRISDAPVPGNKKIARADNHETLAETRGEGGFVVLAPSAGTVHPTGKPYVRLLGGPDTITSITKAQRDQLHLVFNLALDKTPEEEPWDSTQTASIWDAHFGGTDTAIGDQSGDLKPGDDYEQHTDWADILTPAGWTLLGTRGRTRYWRRPGKTDGISATTGHADDRDRLYVFSTSTEFEAEKPYTKFGAYALLQHGGDHSAAARALHAAGYGKRAARQLEAKSAKASGNITADITPAATSSEPVGNPDTLPAGNEPVSNPHTLPAEPPAATFTVADEIVDQTDTGNARKLVEAYGPEGTHEITYVPTSKRWMLWNGARWEPQDDDAIAIERATHIAEALPEHLTDEHRESLNDPKKIEKAEGRLIAFKATSLSRTHLVASVQLASADPAMRTPLERFDQRPYQLNTPTGTIDLHTGAIHTADPSEWHSKITGAPYQRGAATPLWDAFLQETFGGDTEMIRYVRALAGLSAIGEIREHILPFLYGTGANGKSVFLETLQAALGDYAATAPKGLLLARRDQPENEIAELAGRRLVTISEIKEDERFDEELLKRITGGDRLKARRLYENFFEFQPTHTIWLAGNSQPKVSVGGNSFWRRLRLIPFTHTVPEDRRDEQLTVKLKQQELAGILAWIVDGAVDYLANGLHTPLKVQVATDEYQAEEDHLQQFVSERLQATSQGREDTKTVYQAYTAWANDNGYRPMDARVFGKQLRTKIACTKQQSHNRKYYVGFTLLADENADTFTDWRDR